VRFDGFDIAISSICVVLAVVAITAGVHDCGEKRECESRGGAVEKYDCHWMQVGRTPIYTCSWRCVMPEHP
jgi:hypothetical protein